MSLVTHKCVSLFYPYLHMDHSVRCKGLSMYSLDIYLGLVLILLRDKWLLRLNKTALQKALSKPAPKIVMKGFMK